MTRINDYYDDKDNFKKYTNVKSILKYGVPVEYTPDISFVIPTYKRVHLLERAIDSIMKLPESELKTEVIVVDNAYFDIEGSNVQKILLKYDPTKISYYQNQSNIGMFGNWNRCFELAKGHWVAMLHDDDFLSENYTDIILKILPKLDEKTAIVKANVCMIKHGKTIHSN